MTYTYRLVVCEDGKKVKAWDFDDLEEACVKAETQWQRRFWDVYHAESGGAKWSDWERSDYKVYCIGKGGALKLTALKYHTRLFYDGGEIQWAIEKQPRLDAYL